MLFLDRGERQGRGVVALGTPHEIFSHPLFRRHFGTALPGAAAVILAPGRLSLTFALATAIGCAAGVGGYLLAFFREFPVGATQTVTAAAVLGVVVLSAGLVRRLRRG